MSSNSSSLTPAVTVTDVPRTSRVWLRIVLLAVAGLESLIGLDEFSEAFDLHDAPLSFRRFWLSSRRYHCACRLHSGGLVLRIVDNCAVRYRMGLVTDRDCRCWRSN